MKKILTLSLSLLLSGASLWGSGIQPAGGLFKPADNGFYTQATGRYSSFTVNGTEVPVLDGYNNQGDYLGYDLVRFTAPEGTTTTARVKCTSAISSITVHPLMLGIEPVKIDDNTYEFEVPDPAVTPYYLYVDVNNNHLVVVRDTQYDAPAAKGEGIFNVADYLALAGVDATKKPQAKRVAEAFQQAIDDASEYGSEQKHGTVYVPDGHYYLGNLILKSNIDLYMSDGAVLRATDTKSDYRVDYNKTSLGRDGTWWISTVNDPGNPTCNVRIYGHGSIDANGYYWQKRLSSNADRFCITALHIIHARNVSVDGITVMQTPMWGTMVGRSEDVTFTNMKFLNSTDANENDGIDVMESRRVKVDRAIGIALDDPFSTKTWMGQELFKNWTGEPQVLDDVTFDHCVSWTYCGGFKMGHGAQQMQSNVTVRNGVVLNSGRAIGVEPKYVNTTPIGGFRNVLFENIDIEHASGEGWLKILAETPGVGYPPIKDVTLRNINIRQKGSASSLRGTNDEFFVDGVTFDNITMYGNSEPVKTLAELNITNTGFYKNVVFVQDATHESDHRIEAEYCNELQGGGIVANSGSNADADYPGGAYVSSIVSGKYLLFRNVDFGSSCTGLTLRVLNTRSTFKAIVRLDNAEGDVVAEKQFQRNAAGWADVAMELAGVSGTHDLYLSFEHVSGPSTQLSGLNHITVTGRTVNDLTALEAAESPVKVNILTSKQLAVNYVPAEAYQRDIEWRLVSAEPEGCISLSRDGVVTANATGNAVVEARSLWNNEISATFEVEAVDELTFGTLHIEVEDADEIYSPYHYDAAMSIGSVNDPEEEGARGLNSCWNTNFAVYKNVDFGEGAVKATIRKGYPRGSAMEMWIDPVIDSEAQTISGGTKIAEIEYPTPGSSDWTRWATFETPIIADCGGVHTLVLYFKAGGGSAANQNYGAYNWIEFILLDSRPDLEALEAPESMDLNVELTRKLSVTCVPADARQTEVEFSLLSAVPEGCVSVKSDGTVTAVAVGEATVRAASVWNPEIYADILVKVNDKGTFSVLRIEAEDADEIHSPYHYDAAMSIGSVNDPEEEGARGLNSCWNTNFAVYHNIDFQDGAVKATIRKGYVRGSAMEMWIDPVIDSEAQTISGGTRIAEIEYPAIASDWSRWATFETPIETECAGVHTLVLYFKAGGGSAANQNYGAYNWIELRRVKAVQSGVENVEPKCGFKVRAAGGNIVISSEKASETAIYSVDGRCVRKCSVEVGETVVSGLAKGLYIVNGIKIIL